METKIKYCIWDIGKVIYDFSFGPLDQWCSCQTTNLPLYKKRRGKLSYDDYMRGKSSFEEWCQDLCRFYEIPFSRSTVLEIDQAMHDGVSEDFPETRELMEEMQQKGIENCILSNALPNLKDCGKFWDLVKEEYRFTSFEIGAIKPEREIYEYVQRMLGCEYSEIVFIDDKPENIASAAKLGIKAVLFSKADIKQNLSVLTC